MNARLLVSLVSAVEPLLVGVSLAELPSSGVPSTSVVVETTLVGPVAVDEFEEGSALEELGLDDDATAVEVVCALVFVGFGLVVGALLVEAELREEGTEVEAVVDVAAVSLLFVSLQPGSANAKTAPTAKEKWRDDFMR